MFPRGGCLWSCICKFVSPPVGKSPPRPTTRLSTITSLRAWSATVSRSSPSPEAKWSTSRGSSRCHQERANSSTENPSLNLCTREFNKGKRSVKSRSFTSKLENNTSMNETIIIITQKFVFLNHVRQVSVGSHGLFANGAWKLIVS